MRFFFSICEMIQLAAIRFIVSIFYCPPDFLHFSSLSWKHTTEGRIKIYLRMFVFSRYNGNHNFYRWHPAIVQRIFTFFSNSIRFIQTRFMFDSRMLMEKGRDTLFENQILANALIHLQQSVQLIKMNDIIRYELNLNSKILIDDIQLKCLTYIFHETLKYIYLFLF